MSEQVGIRLEVNGWSSAALDDFGLDVYAFRAYHTIARRAGGEGVCFETVEHMAKRCQMSERRMRAALRELEKRGLVERVERSGSTSEYRRAIVAVEAPARGATPASGAAPPRHVVPPTPARGAPKGLPSKDYPLKDEDLKPSSAAPTRAKAEAFMDAYNEHCGRLPNTRTLNGTRRRGIERLQKEHGDAALDVWAQAVKNAAADDFMVNGGYGMDTLLRPGKALAWSERNPKGAPAEAPPASEPVKYERWTGADAMAMFERERAQNGGRLT